MILRSRLLNHLLLFLTPLLFTSCFDLVETVIVHANGTGKFTAEANLSQSKSKLNALLSLDSLYGFKVPSRKDIQSELDKCREALLQFRGLQDIKLKVNMEEYIYSLSFDFDKISTLNEALEMLQKRFDKNHTLSFKKPFAWANNTFERFNVSGTKDLSGPIRKADLALLENSFLTCVYRFDNPILNYSNPEARLSKDRKAILLKIPITGILKGSKDLSDIIQTETH
jgi:hypothetical protein